MGQYDVVGGVGGGMVRIGRWVTEDIGGEGLYGGCEGGIETEGDGNGGIGVEVDNETVLVVGGRALVEGVLVFEEGAGLYAFFSGRPEMIGGGKSRPSAALRDSWRAKSEACHHSRNLSAKILVGNSSLRLDSNLG